ncbi:MAG: type II secretion system protein N [Pseudomonadota bacterium]
MSTSLQSRWSVQGTTFVVWALAAASAVYWGLKLGTAAPTLAAASLPARAPVAADPAAVARLLGSTPVAAAAQPAAPALSSRFALAGIAASRSHYGVALIAVDGRPAKPFRVGSVVVDDLVLRSVDARRAVLATGTNGPAVLTLELPPRPTGASGPMPAPVAAPPMQPQFQVQPQPQQFRAPPGVPPGMVPPGMAPGMAPGMSPQPTPMPTAEPR